MRALRSVFVALLAGLVLVGTAGPAAAHARLESSNPANGAKLATAPTRVTLTFNEQMQAGFNTVTVIGPGDTAWQTGDPVVSGVTVSIAVTPLGPAGVYQIGYRVISDDGHPVTGSVSFTLTAPGPGATAPTIAAPTSAPATSAPATTTAAAPAAPAQDGGAPIWPWIVGAVVLLAGGAAAALRLGRG